MLTIALKLVSNILQTARRDIKTVSTGLSDSGEIDPFKYPFKQYCDGYRLVSSAQGFDLTTQ